jgi:hypothetical protein
VSEATVCRAVGRLCRSRKKDPKGAPESDEFSRRLWHMEVGWVDPERLVFVDEALWAPTPRWLLYTSTRP